MPPKKSALAPIDITDLIAKTKEMPEGIYANFAQFLISNHEVFLDFYHVSPKPGGAGLNVQSAQRIIIPLSLAKGTVEALANVIADFEADHGIELINSREPAESDRIHIWSKASE